MLATSKLNLEFVIIQSIVELFAVQSSRFINNALTVMLTSLFLFE